MRDNASKNEEAGVDPIMEVPQTEEQQLQQGIEDGTHEVCFLSSLFISRKPLRNICCPFCGVEI